MMLDFLQSIIDGFRNMILWLPVIWNDRQWDQAYLIIILERKLRLIERYYEKAYPKRRWLIGQKRSSAYCRMLLTRLKEDDYLHRQLLGHYRRWGHPEMRWDKLMGLSLTYPLANGCEEQRKANDEFRKFGDESDRQQQQDLDEVFRLMRKWIQRWWD